MMKKLILLSTFILGLALFFSSCEEEILEQKPEISEQKEEMSLGISSDLDLSDLRLDTSQDDLINFGDKKYLNSKEEQTLLKNNENCSTDCGECVNWEFIIGITYSQNTGYANIGIADRAYFEEYDVKAEIISDKTGLIHTVGFNPGRVINSYLTSTNVFTYHIISLEDLQEQENYGVFGTQNLEYNTNYDIKFYRRPKSNICEYVSGTVPHYYEYDSTENPEPHPSGYWWCGHAALKCVGMYHGTLKGLDDIHNIFIENANLENSSDSQGNPYHYEDNNFCDGTHYCSTLYDLLHAAKEPNGYEFEQSHIYPTEDIDEYFQKLKDGVLYNYPPIVENFFDISVGHFYVVTGFKEVKDSNGNINYDESELYLRDVLQENPCPSDIPSAYAKADKSVCVSHFYTKRYQADDNGNPIIGDGDLILFVKP